MKPKTTIFLLLLLLAACAVFVVVRHTDLFKKAPSQPTAAEMRVFPAEPNGAKSLTITPRDGDPLVFEKDDEKWHIRIGPDIRAAAVRYKVDRAADLLKELRCQTRFGAKDPHVPSPEMTGLGDPLWTVELLDQEDRTFALQVGRTRRQGSGNVTYVRVVGDDRICVVERDFANALEPRRDEYRDKTVLDLDRDRIVRLRTEGPKAFELKKVDGNWEIVHPISARPDPNKVKDLIGAVASVEAEEFVADKPSSLVRYGLEEGKEAMILRVWEAPEPPVTTAPATQTAPAEAPEPKEFILAFGIRTRDNRKVYAKLRTADPVFRLPVSLLDKLAPAIDELRDKRLLAFQPGAVTQVDLEIGGQKAWFAKGDAGWLMAKPYAGEANSQRIEQLLKDLAALEPERWADEKEAPPKLSGLDPARGKITLHPKDEGKPVTLLIGSASSTGLMTFLKEADAESVAVVKTSDTASLLSDPATYWGTELFVVASEAKITRLAVTRPGETWTIVRDERDGWKATTPLATKADGDNVRKIIDRLSRLRADKVVALGPMVPNTYVRDKNLITVQFVSEIRPEPIPPATTAPTTQPDEDPAATQPAAVPATQPATAPATGPASAPATQPATAPAPIVKTHVVQAIQRNGKTYAWVVEKKAAAVGEFPGDLYDALNAELRDRRVWQFGAGRVTGVRIVAGSEKVDLERRKDEWVCPLDKLLKIDAKKVTDFLSDIGPLQTERFYTHKSLPTDTEKYGFKEPWLTIGLDVEGGKPLSLTISNEGLDKTKNRFARAAHLAGVFLITADDLKKLSKTLKDFEK